MGRIGRRIRGRTASCSFWLCSCLAVFALHIFAFRQTGGQPVPQEAPSEVNRFLDEMERQVMGIAAAAAANYEKTTELVATCGDPGNCSRDICSPLKGDLESLSCVNLVNNSNCSPSPGPSSQFCNTGLVTYKRSYVRIPRAQLLGIPAEVSTAICVHRNLELLFKKFHQNTSYGTAFVNSKLATIDGTQRFYPGRELKDCAGTYDPRRRPWYAGAISVKKRLVILLDNGQSMNTLVWHTPDTSAFAVAQRTASALLWTLTPEDEASVTLFAAIATQLNATVSVPETGLDASTLQSVDDELAAQTVSQGASNLTAGLTSALSFLKMGDEDALKAIVVFTDGSLGDELNQSELEPLLEEIRTNNVTVLVFVLGGQSTSTSFETLKTLACTRLPGQMSVEVFTEVGNPMFGLRNLFSFFARAHLQVDQGPFWQSQYTNYDNLGDAVDVSYPAMTKNNHLIGVASVGIQVKGLSPTIEGNLGPALVERAHKYTINPRPTGLLCQPEEDTFASGSSKDGTTGICPSTSQHSFRDLSCCQQCGGLKLNKSTFSSGVRAAVIAGATLLGVAVLLSLLWFWSCRSKPPPPPPKLPILQQPVHAEEPKYL